jgi:hypothetical protein
MKALKVLKPLEPENTKLARSTKDKQAGFTSSR